MANQFTKSSLLLCALFVGHIAGLIAEPQITAVIPPKPAAGTTMVIRGNRFDKRTENVEVRLGNTRLTVVEANERELLVQIPEYAKGGPLNVAVKKSPSAPMNLVLLPTHKISSSPQQLNPGAQGQVRVQILGTDEPQQVQLFSTNPAVAMIEGQAVEATKASSGGTQNSAVFKVVGTGGGAPAFYARLNPEPPLAMNSPSEATTPSHPIINDVTPGSVQSNEPITIQGVNFCERADQNTVRVGNQSARIIDASPRRIVAITPENVISGDVIVTCNGVPSNHFPAWVKAKLVLTATRLKLMRGESSTVTVRLLNVKEPSEVYVVNETPFVAHFVDRAVSSFVHTSGGENNIATVTLVGIQPGTFLVSAHYNAPRNQPTELTCPQTQVSMKAGESTKIALSGKNEVGETVPVGNVEWRVVPEQAGTIRNDGTFTASNSPGLATIVAKCGNTIKHVGVVVQAGATEIAKLPEQTTKAPEQGAKPPEQTAKPPEKAEKPREQIGKVPEQGAKVPEQGAKPQEQVARAAEQVARVPEQVARIPEQGTRSSTQNPQPGDGLSFNLVLKNPTSNPQPATVADPVPPGCSHLDTNSVKVTGSLTAPTNASSETGGVQVSNITVPPQGNVTITYMVYVAEGTPTGFSVNNAAVVNDVPSNTATTPTVSNPQGTTQALQVSKGYTGVGGHTTSRPPHTGTTTRPPKPPDIPHTPDEPPPKIPTTTTTTRKKLTCDCCCYKNLVWKAGNAIVADIVVPAADSVELPLGEQLPLAAEGFDSDLLFIECELKGCTGDSCIACPPCQALTILQMDSPLTFHWRIVSGGGMLETGAHLNSHEVLASAAVFTAPDEMPKDPTVVLELTADDSPEKLTNIDDAPVKKTITIKLVPKAGAPPPLGPRQLKPGPTITPPPSKCPCAPFYKWTAGAPLKADLTLPKYVCEKGYAVFSAPGSDSDHLTAGCAGGCSSSSQPAELDLADALAYRWKASKGAILGGLREQVVFKPAGTGDVTVDVDVQDTGSQFSDSTVHKQGKLTVVGIDPSDTGDYIVPYSKDNIVRYIIKPAGLSADEVILEVRDKDGQLQRRLTDLPKTNDGSKGYAEYKWDGLSEFKTPLPEKGSPYTYWLTMVKGEARCRLKIEERKVKEWDFTYRISDLGTGSGVSGMDLKTIIPTLVETTVQPDGGDLMRVPVYSLEEKIVSPTDKRALVTLMKSFGREDKFLFYTSPTAPNQIKYLVTIISKEGGALDIAGNEWDMDPTKAGIQRTLEWRFILNDKGELTGFKEEIKD